MQVLFRIRNNQPSNSLNAIHSIQSSLISPLPRLLRHLPKRLDPACADGPMLGPQGGLAVKRAPRRKRVALRQLGHPGTGGGEGRGEHALALGVEAGLRL